MTEPATAPTDDGAPALRVLPSPDDDAAPAPEVVDGSSEGAYQLWAWATDQNAAEVARRLALPERTVQDWAKRHGWRARLEQDRKELAERTWRSLETALVGVAPQIVRRLNKIATGQGDTKRVQLKDGTVAEVDVPVPYQAQVIAANSLLDRFGLSAANAPRERPAGTPASEEVFDRDSFMALSPEERARWLDERRRRA